MTGWSVWILNRQNPSIEGYRVRGTDHPTSKNQPARANAQRSRAFARARRDGPIAMLRHLAVSFARAAALSLTNCKGFVPEMWERAMRGVGFRLVICVCVALTATGCYRAPLNPPRLVVSTDTDMSVQLFMQATILLANYYGYSNVRYADIRERARRSNVAMIDFVIPESIRATPALRDFANVYEHDPAGLNVALQKIGGYQNLVKYYIRTGLRASQSVCRTYLLEIEEKNDFLEFLQKEIGVASAVSTAVLALVNANTTLTTSFMIARTGIDGGIDVYQEYRYLKIDRDAARVLVEAAQNQLAKYFLEQVDKTVADPNLVAGGYTFSDALHAVSTIEYQCTRSGIRNLLARSINNSPSNLVVDQETGNIAFRSASMAPVNSDGPGGVGGGGSGGATGGGTIGGTPGGSTGGNLGSVQSGAGQSGGQATSSKPGTILIALMRTGSPEKKKEVRATLQSFLSDTKVKQLLGEIPSTLLSNPSNIIIEEVAVATDPAFVPVQAHLVQLARNQGLLKK
jgi:hypothetical protein